MDASQEILALGMCQFVGSFAGSLPITASFGRSTVISASGVQTPFGGIGMMLVGDLLQIPPVTGGYIFTVPRTSVYKVAYDLKNLWQTVFHGKL